MFFLALIAAFGIGLPSPIPSIDLTPVSAVACADLAGPQMRYLPSDPFVIQQCFVPYCAQPIATSEQTNDSANQTDDDVLNQQTETDLCFSY